MKAAALPDCAKGEVHPEPGAESAPRREPSQLNSVRAVPRLAIRTGRIALGFVLASVSFWVLATGIATLDEPFATLSPMRLIGALFAACGGLALSAIALVTAFGAGPTIEKPSAEDDGWNGLP